MPNRRRSSAQRAAPKLFRCTGYGNCDMVFTRSEHLARHERKHTGEKPYKCVVTGCGRMFSRFDNMMQHTQTHEKSKKCIHPSSSSSSPTLRRSTSTVHGHRLQVPSLTPIKIEPWSEELKHNIPDLVMATSMVNSRTLPLPTRRASFSSYSDQSSYPHVLHPIPNNTNYHPSYSDVAPSTYYHNQQDHISYENNIPRNRSSWPPKREEQHPLQYNNYHPSINNNHHHHYYNNSNDDDNETFYRRSSISTFSSDSNLTSPVALSFPQEPTVVRRRISIDDLRLPIENLRNIQLEEEKYHDYYYKNSKPKDTVDITPAEYEALEGFSRFHSESVIVRGDSTSPSESTPSPILRNNSPTIAAQVCAMRQRVMTQNESFLRR